MYLLDTNILIHHLNNRHGISDKIRQAGFSNCSISEITILELLYGVAGGSSQKRDANLQNIREIERIFANKIVPVRGCFNEFASQKTRLRQAGKLVSDFDLLIGCTALTAGHALVSVNFKEMIRIDGLQVENWVSL